MRQGAFVLPGAGCEENLVLQIPLVPKNPDILRVIGIGRLSKPKDSDEQTRATLESSGQYAEDYLSKAYPGEIEFRFLGEQISGLVVDRKTILEAMDLIESGDWDLVLVEDVSRIYRNPRHIYGFVQDCVDAGIRLIAIADQLDTADENWETMLSMAAARHGMFIPDTRRRIKRTAKHAFHNGGMVMKVKFGYEKVSREVAISGERGPKGLRMARLVEYQSVFDDMARLLLETISPQRVVDYLNREGVPVGRYVKRKSWNVALLKGLVTDPIVHGTRTFQKVLHRHVLRNGNCRREANANPDTTHYPELAFWTRERQEEALAAVGWKIKWVGSPGNKNDSRRRSRSRALWPNLAAKCAVCGRTMVALGAVFKCAGSIKEHGQPCWNHVQVPIQLIRDKTLEWLRTSLQEFPAAHEAMIDAALEALRRDQSQVLARQQSRQREIQNIERQQDNLTAALANGAKLPSVVKMLTSLEDQLAKLRREEAQEALACEALPLGLAKADVVAAADGVLAKLMASSIEFADVLRDFFTEFAIRPVQALDSGQVRPQGVLKFRLGDNDSGSCGNQEFVTVTLDLFHPPEHIRLLPKIVELRSTIPQPTYRQIGAQIGACYMTVKRALAYSKLMTAQGAASPYIVVTERPEYASRWRHAS